MRIGDIVKNKVGGGIGTVDRTNLGSRMRDLVLVRFHKNGVPSGDGLCIPRTQLEPVETSRPLREIASEIMLDWPKPYYAAVPYIAAMTQLNSITGVYGADTADEIVLRFLTNAGHWRGETARRVKRELSAMSRAHQRRRP